MGLALLLVLDYREAETVFTEPLLLGTVVGGAGAFQVWPHPESLRGWDVRASHSHGLQRPGACMLTLSSWLDSL